MDADLRRMALDFARKNADAWGSDDIDNLTALLAEVRAEAEARVVEAVKRAIVGLRYDNPAQSAEECAWDDALWDAYRAVERLAPADYVAVRREDLQHVEGWVHAGHEGPCDACDRIRTALSRGST
jgi:hypothetical protein